MDGLEAVLVDDRERCGGWRDNNLLDFPGLVLPTLTRVQ